MLNKTFLKIGFNTLIQTSGKIVSGGLGIFTVLLLTRYLGAGGYGLFTLAFTFVSFFSVIADLGLQTTMVRELSQGDHPNEHYGSFLILKIILIFVSSALAYFSLLFFPYSSTAQHAISIAILAVAISGMTTYGTIILQSQLRLDLVTIIDIVTKVFTVGFIALFVFLKFNLLFIIAAVFLGNIVGLTVTFLLIREKINLNYKLENIKNILKMSIPIGITAFLGAAYFKLDTIILSIFKNSVEVGYYSLSYKILENILIIWGFYMASVYPLMSKFIGLNDKKQLKEIFKNSLYVVLLLSIPFLLICTFFASYIIEFFGGKSFMSGTPALQILVFALPFLFVNSLFSDFFFARKENKIVFVGIVISLVINLILNLYYIPKYGFIGASYITIISAVIFTIYSVIRLLLNKKTYFYSD